MFEQSELVVHKLHACAMIRLEKIERHVGSRIHGLRIILKSRHTYIICSCDINLRLLAHRCGIERGLHRPIMGEGSIILPSHPNRDKKQRQQYDRKMSKHHFKSDATYVLLHKYIHRKRNFSL